MLNQVKLDNLGPLKNIDWGELGPINLVIGNNGSGKTFLLKAMYSVVRTLEEYKRGHEQRSLNEILVEKLRWTFQSAKIGDLVSKGLSAPLACALKIDQEDFSFNFGKDTIRQISPVHNQVPPRAGNSIFFPPKEAISIEGNIIRSREIDKEFGFDDSYLDLVTALRLPATKIGNGRAKKLILENGPINVTQFFDTLPKVLQNLEEICEGKIEFDEISKQWLYKRGNQAYPIWVTAEGFKKIASLHILLGNGYLDPRSVVFLDEPEDALHPAAISKFLDVLALLAGAGMQFFLASHSYFVVKKLLLIALKKRLSIPVLSVGGPEPVYSNLLQGMPENPIIDESIRLYEEEVDLVLR